MRRAEAALFLVPADADFDRAMTGWVKHRGEMLAMTCRPVSSDGRRLAPSKTAVRLALCRAGDPAPIGRFTVFDINPRNRSAEFGYLLDPARRGRGYGAALVRLGLDAWFQGSPLNKMHGQTAAFNVPSCRLLERLGLRRDAVLRDHHEHDGALYDDYVYSLLRREWAVRPWRLAADADSVAAVREAWRRIASDFADSA